MAPAASSDMAGSAAESPRWQQALPNLNELRECGTLQIQQDRLTQMAAALAFRTLFGLLPVLVVATVLVKALGMEDYYLGPLGRLFAFCGLDNVRIIPPAGAAESATITLDTWLQDRVRDAKQVNVAAIGWVGVAVTLYAAISLMVTIENCFNIIYRAPRGRSWANRVPIYWFVLTTSPLLLIFSTYVDSRFQQLMGQVQMQGSLTAAIGAMWTLFAIWLVMFAAYMLFPNTRVRPKPAMIGALAAAVLLEIGKRTMGAYLQNALAIGQLYGSLGLVPLFMFWVYLMWLAVLFGLEVSAVLQRNGQAWPIVGFESTPEQANPLDLVTMIVNRLTDGLDAAKGVTDQPLDVKPADRIAASPGESSTTRPDLPSTTPAPVTRHAEQPPGMVDACAVSIPLVASAPVPEVAEANFDGQPVNRFDPLTIRRSPESPTPSSPATSLFHRLHATRRGGQSS